jgi:hypothetical protein
MNTLVSVSEVDHIKPGLSNKTLVLEKSLLHISKSRNRTLFDSERTHWSLILISDFSRWKQLLVYCRKRGKLEFYQGIIKVWKIPKCEEVNQYGDTELFTHHIGLMISNNEVIWDLKHHPVQVRISIDPEFISLLKLWLHNQLLENNQ